MNVNVGNSLIAFLNTAFVNVAAFIPNFLAGIVIFLIGIILGSIVKRIVLGIFKALNLETYLRKYGIPEAKRDYSWTNILAEIVRWFVIVLFLIPAADAWGLRQVTVLLNEFLLYLPNVFVSAIVGLVGFGVARLAYDVVLASTRDIAPEGSQTIASVTRWAIMIFVLLAVLNQLGVAQDLVRILFTGFVAMIAIAGGIAFGLGGQETARSLLESIRKGLQSSPSPKQQEISKREKESVKSKP
jgi:hypothetical protein